MRSLRAWALRVAGVFRRATDERDFDAQMQADIDLQIDDAIRAGLSPAEARRQTLASIGGIDAAKEAWRDRRGLPFVETLARDVSHALRVLWRNKGWSAVAIASLALGVGANAAIFGAANALLLRKLPIGDADSLVTLRWKGENRAMTNFSDYGHVPGGAVEIFMSGGDFSFEKMRGGATGAYPTFERLAAANTTLDRLFAVGTGPSVNLIVDGKGDLASSHFVSGGFYAALGVPPAAGRPIQPSDDVAGAEPVVVLSYAYWQRRFGGDRSIVGKPVRLNSAAFTVVGVSGQRHPNIMEAGSNPPDLSLPLASEPLFRPGESRLRQATNWWLVMMGRLKPGVSVAQVDANLGPVHERVSREAMASMLGGLPDNDRREAVAFGFGEKIPRLHVVSGARGAYDPAPMMRTPLAILAVLVGIVLLVVCVNLGNLSLALTASREREIAVRRAVGATPRRLMRQILTEHLVVAGLGGGASLLVAYVFQDLIRLYFTTEFDLTVVAFAFAVAAATGVLVGVLPAVRASRTPTALPAGSGASHHSRLASTLLVAQVVMSLVLLVGAGLFVRTLLNLRGVQPGFDPGHLVLFTIDPASNQYDEAKTKALYEALATNLRALPGVSAASFSSQALLDGTANQTFLYAEGRPKQSRAAYSMTVDPDFFKTMGIPLRVGRPFDGRDSGSTVKTVIVNETLARAFFGDGNPLGRRLGSATLADEKAPLPDPKDADMEIVGVVADTRHRSLREASPQLFFPQGQSPGGPRTFEVRTQVPPEDLMPSIRQVVERADPALPIITLSTQASTIEGLSTQERIIALASATLGGLTLVVSMVGLFGLLSYAVTRRTRDIAVRMAIGARKSSVLRSVLGEALLLVVVGSAIGLAVALTTTRFLESLLFGLVPNDPLVLGGAVTLMLVVAAAAAYLPARRAANVDPMVVLRQE